MALVGSGVGTLGQEELDRISTGRKMGFDFKIDDGDFKFTADTRPADLADQLYLFAAKLAMPRWDAEPGAARQGGGAAAVRKLFDQRRRACSSATSKFAPARPRSALRARPTPAELDAATPEGFRKVWEPLLAQGPIEVQVFGDFDTRRRDRGACARPSARLPPRQPIRRRRAAPATPTFPRRSQRRWC